MDQLTEMLALNGYGVYVWPAYGFAALLLIGLLWRTWSTLRAQERTLGVLQDGPAPRGGAAPARRKTTP